LNNKAEPEYTILPDAPRRFTDLGTNANFISEIIPNYEHYCQGICSLA